MAKYPKGVTIDKSPDGRHRGRINQSLTGGKRLEKRSIRKSDIYAWLDLTLSTLSGSREATVALSPSQLLEASRCIPLLEAAGISLREATDFALQHLKPPCILSVKEASQKYLQKLAKKSPSYLDNVRKRLAALSRAFPVDVHAITIDSSVEDWIRGTVPGPGFRNQVRSISPFFSWAIKQGFCSRNPLKGVELEPWDTDKVEIVTPEEAEIILQPSPLLSAVVIGLYCGFRPEEASRLEWHEIHLEATRPHIDLPKEKAKDRERRVCYLSDQALAWLIQNRPEQGGRVVSVADTYYYHLGKITKKLGWQRWKHDCLRHSYASYRIGAGISEMQVAEELGHSSLKMMKHYKEIVKNQSQIGAYWSLLPPDRS